MPVYTGSVCELSRYVTNTTVTALDPLQQVYQERLHRTGVVSQQTVRESYKYRSYAC